MASISTAILCSAAEVRENLLYVLSGGLTRIHVTNPSPPIPFNVMLGIIVEVGAHEDAQAHELRVAVKHAETANEVARIVGGFQSSGDNFPGESLYVPMVVDLRAAGLSVLGAYDIHTEVDGNVGPHLTCYVLEAPSRSA